MAQRASGLAIVAYCRRHGLRAHGFYWWRRELARRDARKPAAFVPVVVAEQSVSRLAGRVEIFLSRHRRVRVIGAVDRRMLAEVLSVLEERDRRGGQREGFSC